MSFLASRRLALFVSALSLMSVAPYSLAATTTINLHKADGSNCIVTTVDEKGVHLDPAGGTAMVVDGASLAEDPANPPNSNACLPAGGASSDFHVAPVVLSSDANGSNPLPSPQVGTQFWVNWSASSAATTCVRLGSTVGAWVNGSVVSSPAGAHHEPVTVPQRGTYAFGVVCTNATGYQAPGSGMLFKLPAPAPAPHLTAPTQAATGTSMVVSWPGPMTNLTTCQGTSTKTSGSTSTAITLSGWSNAAFTPAFDASSNTYKQTVQVPSSGVSGGDKLNLALTCSNQDGSVSSDNTATVTLNNTPPIAVALQLSASTATTGSPPSPTTITVSASANTALANMSCTGTLLKGATSITTGWSGWTSPSFTIPATGALSQVVTLPPTGLTAGSYIFKLSCSNSSQAAADDTAHPATLVVSDPPATSCLATIPANSGLLAGVSDQAARLRLNTADIQYGSGASGTRTGVSLTEFANIWGYADPVTPAAVGWPGIVGAAPGFLMARNNYFGVHFKTPPATTPPSRDSGFFTYPTYGATDPISVSISATCGDFSGNPNVDGCYANNVLSNDDGSLTWRYDSTGQQGISKYRCYLKPNTDYYLNMMFTTTAVPPNNKCNGAATTGKCRIAYVAR